VSLAAREKLLVEVAKENLSVVAARHPLEQLGHVYEELEEALEALACCQILVHANVAKFQEFLVWSAMTRRHFLARCRRERHDGGFHAARSRSAGVFCALAAGDPALAIEVGGLLPEATRPEGEYAEDFAYHWLVYLLSQRAPEASLRPALKALRDGDGDAERAAVADSLINQDAATFTSAFSGLLAAQTAAMEESIPLHEDQPSFEPRARLFVEGLALLQLAEQRGMAPATLDHGPLCPALARVRALKQRPDDIFASF